MADEWRYGQQPLKSGSASGSPYRENEPPLMRPVGDIPLRRSQRWEPPVSVRIEENEKDLPRRRAARAPVPPDPAMAPAYEPQDTQPQQNGYGSSAAPVRGNSWGGHYHAAVPGYPPPPAMPYGYPPPYEMPDYGYAPPYGHWPPEQQHPAPPRPQRHPPGRPGFPSPHEGQGQRADAFSNAPEPSDSPVFPLWQPQGRDLQPGPYMSTQPMDPATDFYVEGYPPDWQAQSPQTMEQVRAMDSQGAPIPSYGYQPLSEAPSPRARSPRASWTETQTPHPSGPPVPSQHPWESYDGDPAPAYATSPQPLPEPTAVPLRDTPNTGEGKRRSGLFIVLVLVLLINSLGAVYFTGIADPLLTQVGIPVWAELSERISSPEDGEPSPVPTPFGAEGDPSAGGGVEVFVAGDAGVEDTPTPFEATDSPPTAVPQTLAPLSFASSAPIPSDPVLPSAMPQTLAPLRFASLASVPPASVSLTPAPQTSAPETPAPVTAATPIPVVTAKNPSGEDASAASLQAYLQSTQGGIQPASHGGPRLNEFTVAPASAIVPVTLTFSLITNDMVKEVRLTANSVPLTPQTYVSPTPRGDQLVWKIPIPFESPYTGDIRARLRYGGEQSNWTDSDKRCAVDVR